MSGFDAMLNKSVVIERSTAGAVDEYGQPSRTYTDLATVKARIDDSGTGRQGGEEPTTHGGGTVVREYKVFLRPTDVIEADIVRDGTRRYQVVKVLELYSIATRHHLELIVERIEPQPVT